MNIQIKGGRVIDPKNGIDTTQDIFISNGKIAAIGNTPGGFHSDRMIDASGLIVCPGLIDLSVRLREPGYEYKATLESEMCAAIAGGITSLVCPPDTDPPLDEPGLVEMLKYRAKGLNQAHVFPLGALTQGLRGEKLTEMAELVDAGCVGFSQGDAPLPNNLVLLRTMAYASTFGFSVWLRPQDISLAKGGVAHDGEVATRLGLPTIPTCAETIALSNILILARETGARIHLSCLSSADAVEMVRQAKQQGLDLTCDIAATHLHLSEMDVGFFDSNCNLTPPLRGIRDRDALRRGLRDGTIDAICSNHTPVDDDAKQLPFAQAESGATGLELLLPLVLQWAQQDGISLLDALSKVTSGPSKVLGMELADLGVGIAADLCVFDPNAYWKVEAKALKSQGKNSPFLGLEVPGKVFYAIVDGQIVYSLKD